MGSKKKKKKKKNGSNKGQRQITKQDDSKTLRLHPFQVRLLDHIPWWHAVKAASRQGNWYAQYLKCPWYSQYLATPTIPSFSGTLNDTYREKLCYTQSSTKMAARLLLIFFMIVYTTKFSYHVLKSEKCDSPNRQ